MKRISSIFCVVFLFLTNKAGDGLYAQSDADIRAAGRAVTDAGNALRPQRKFSDNDSTPWLFGGDITMNLRSNHVTNWAGGGEDQMAINSVVNMFYNYRKEKRTLENYLTLGY